MARRRARSRDNGVLAETWESRYWETLACARERAAAAMPETDLIACGFTNNVDLVVTLDDELLARLVDGRTIDLDGPRQMHAAVPDELMTAVCQCVALGEGYDLPVSNPETLDWLIAQIGGRRQLGGTSAQTANTLAWLGFPTLVHLTGCSPEQAAAFERPEHVLVPIDGGLRPVSEAANPDDPTMWHVALEYTAGLKVEIAGRAVVAPAGSRVIVSCDPVNSTFQIDPGFVDAVEAAHTIIRRAMISGYSQIIGEQFLDRLIKDSVAAARRWRSARPDMVIHAELGAMPKASTLAEVMETISFDVTSIGFNEDELRDLTSVWGFRFASEPKDVRAMLEAVRHRLLTDRVCVHTARYAMSLTNGDAEQERSALLFGALVASTRARIGRYPTFEDLEESLRVTFVHPDGARLVEELGLPDGIGANGSESFVVVPTISVPKPAAMVGLGDSFTGGVLAML